MIQAILFDYDGVIVDSMSHHAKAWQDIFAHYGISIDPMEIFLQEGRTTPDVVRIIFQKHGRPIDQQTCWRIAKQKEQQFVSFHKAKLNQEAIRLVQELHQNEIPLGLVTGSPRHSVEAVVAKNILALFRVFITADDVREGKPSPQPYLTALKKLSIDPEMCLVVENAPMGIQSAREAGLKVIGITTTLPEDALQQADEVVNSFQELRETLFRKIDLYENPNG